MNNTNYVKANPSNIQIGQQVTKSDKRIQNKVIYEVIRIVGNTEKYYNMAIEIEVKRIDGKLINGKPTEIRTTGWFYIIV